MRSRTATTSSLFVPALIVSLTVPAASRAQVAYDSPSGRVEVLGLKRWTLQMLQDSVRRYVPGQELHDAACMVTLRDSLHFADASVESFSFGPQAGGGGKPLLTIKVVEPEDSLRVQWDVRERNEFSMLIPDYAPLVLAVTDSGGVFWRARLAQWLWSYRADSTMRAMTLAPAPEAAREDARRLWDFLDARRNDRDRRRAIQLLRSDGFYVNRIVASLVLSNFAATDSTWWALVRALRDPHDAVREFAVTSLELLPPRPVNWAPAASDLRLLLGGTNLPAMGSVIAALDRTAISPSLADTLLHENSEWLLATLASEQPIESPAAHRLLIRLNSGVDLGATRANWVRWAATR